MEEIWQHALQFLDQYRLENEDCDIDNLYQFNDPSGLLEDHRNALETLFREEQVDIKILYAELIRMLINEERQMVSDKTKFDTARSITKITGYQELTNHLQRFLNKQFMLDIAKLKLVKDKDEIKAEDSESMSKRLDILEQTCSDLQRENSELKLSNEKINKEISELRKHNVNIESQQNDTSVKWQEIFQKYEEKFSSVTSSKESHTESKVISPLFTNKLENINKDLEKLEGKMTTLINQANTLMITNVQHSEKLSTLEEKAEDFDKKVSDLESADLYLQQAHHMVVQKAEQIENMLSQVKEDKTKKVRYEDHKNVNVKDELRTFESEKLVETIIHPSQNLQGQISELQRKVEILQDQFNETHKGLTSETKFLEEVIKKQNTEVNQSVYVLKPDRGQYGQYPEDNKDKPQFKDILQKIKFLEEKIAAKHETSTTKEISHSHTEKSEKVENTTIKIEEKNQDTVSKVEHIHKIISLMLKQDTATTLQLLHLQRVLIDLQDTKNSYRFIEMIGGLDRSLNQVAEDMMMWREKVETLSGQKSKIVTMMKNQQEILDEQKNDINTVTENLEKVKEQEIKDFELFEERIKALESLLASLKMGRKKRDKIENVKKRKKYGSQASIDPEEMQTLLGTPKPSRWLSNLFTKNSGSGTICC